MCNSRTYVSLLIVTIVTVMFILTVSGCSTTPEVSDDVNNAMEPLNSVTETVNEVTESVNPDNEIVQEETTPIIEDTPSETTIPSGACVDTDDGIDYAVKGTVTITNDDGSTRKYTDYCRHGSSEGYVFEYYCANDTVASLDYNCPKGCNNNGACYP